MAVVQLKRSREAAAKVLPPSVVQSAERIGLVRLAEEPLSLFNVYPAHAVPS
ncbi:hypothetical protein [Streptomyces sp. NPDC058644]|uniref:hypothetical protein n=1 Tax=unclassified Streptomyces TaxID=2593676 RepID=UPI00365C79BC